MSFDWAKRILERPWQGYLTKETAEPIAKAILRLLQHKRFVIAAVHDFRPHFHPRIEVRPGCSLRAEWTDKDPCPVKWSVDNYATIQFSAGDYQYLWNTSFEGRPSDPFEILPAGQEAKNKNQPYFKLDRDHFAVLQINHDGALHQWVFQVDDRED